MSIHYNTTMSIFYIINNFFHPLLCYFNTPLPFIRSRHSPVNAAIETYPEPTPVRQPANNNPLANPPCFRYTLAVSGILLLFPVFMRSVQISRPRSTTFYHGEFIMSIINVENLSHGFGDRAIFHNVSFRLVFHPLINSTF